MEITAEIITGRLEKNKLKTVERFTGLKRISLDINYAEKHYFSKRRPYKNL